MVSPVLSLNRRGSAILDQLNLTLNFVVDSRLQEPEAVQVLDFAAGAELLLTLRADGDVRVAAEVAVLHVAFRDAEPHDERVERAGVCHRFIRRPHHRFRHDFDQRRAGAVQVNAGLPRTDAVIALACVLFEVSARQIHHLHVGILLLRRDEARDLAAEHDRQFELADLIALRQIRVEIILAVENRTLSHLRADRETELSRADHRFAVQDRKGARQRHIDRAGVRIRFTAEAVVSRGENLRMGRELNVSLKTNDHFPLHVCLLSIHC